MDVREKRVYFVWSADGGDAVARRGGPWRPVSSGGPRRVLSPFPRCSFPQVPSFCVRKTEAGGAARRLTYYPNMGAVWVGTPYGEFPKVFLNTRSLGTKTLPILRSNKPGGGGTKPK